MKAPAINMKSVCRLAAALSVPALVLATAQPAHACAVCFGDRDSAMAQGAVSGVLFMVIVTYVVLFGIVGFAVHWRIRAYRLQQSLAATGGAVGDDQRFQGAPRRSPS